MNIKWYDRLTKSEKFHGDSVVNKNVRNCIAWTLAGIMVGWFLWELWDFVQWLW